VTGNLTAIGGSAAQAFFDDGTNGDVTANDGVHSFLTTVASGSGMILLPITLTDAEARTGNTNIALTITGPVPLTAISSIQGQTDASLTGAFTVQGVVTAVLPNLSPRGFFMEEEASDVDGDPLTSEGIFVAATSLPQVGETVRVQGTVTNNNGLTQFGAGATVTVRTATAPSERRRRCSSPVSQTPRRTWSALKGCELLSPVRSL
jgi:predicted extracellular nuclease